MISNIRPLELAILVAIFASAVVFADDKADVSFSTSAIDESGSSDGELEKVEKHLPTDLVFETPSGRSIDVGQIFDEQGKAFEKALALQRESQQRTMILVKNRETGRPLLLIGRRGKVLNGAFASFSDDGPPIAYATYDRGERDATLFTWDDTHHPLVFAQYKSGQLDGLRCLFRTCCESCSNVHLWVVQEWERGELRSAHIVGNDGKAKEIKTWGDDPYGRISPAIEEATRELEAFEVRFDRGEAKLKQLVSNYYFQERQLASSRSQLVAAQHRYRFLMAAQSGSRPSFASFPTGGAMSFG